MNHNIETGPASTRAAMEEYFVPARQVWERYGIHKVTLSRWVNDSRLEFPQPVYLGRFRHWRMSDLLEWERKRAAQSTGAQRK